MTAREARAPAQTHRPDTTMVKVVEVVTPKRGLRLVMVSVSRRGRGAAID